MSFLPGINIKTKVYRVKSKKDLYAHDNVDKSNVKLVNSLHPTVSSKRKLKLQEEIKQIKCNYKNHQCFKTSTKKRRSNHYAQLKMEYYHWDKWL